MKSIDLALFMAIWAVIDTLIAVVLGFLTLNLTKKKGEKTNRFVLDLCMSFQREIIQEYIFIKNFHSEHHLNLIGNIYVDKERCIIKKPQKMKKNSERFLQKVMCLFNEMDMFAAKLLTTCREEEYQAYKIQGRAYCDIIRDLKGIYDLFLLTSGQDYYYLSELYNIWSMRC